MQVIFSNVSGKSDKFDESDETDESSKSDKSNESDRSVVKFWSVHPLLGDLVVAAIV